MSYKQKPGSARFFGLGSNEKNVRRPALVAIYRSSKEMLPYLLCLYQV